MRRALIPLAALIVAMGCLGFLYAWAGLYNVGASSGHWPVTRWFLHFALTNPIETHAIGIEPPPPDKPSLFNQGLRHYDAACAPCHGTPDTPRKDRKRAAQGKSVSVSGDRGGRRVIKKKNQNER